MESRFLIDAISVTSRTMDEGDWLRLLGLETVVWDVVEENKRGGFQYRMDYDGMHLHYGGTQGWKTWLEFSGQGCRDFETMGNGDYDAIFRLYLDDPDNTHITRLDVAFDDADTELLDMEQLCHLVMEQQYVSKFKCAEVDYCVPQKDNGHTIYFGSKHSDFFIRIYDKAKERGYNDGRHWVRVELQMRRDYAQGFVSKSGSVTQNLTPGSSDPAAAGSNVCYKLDIKAGLLGTLKSYVRFVEEEPTDSNKWRWPTMAFWDKFLAGVDAVNLIDKPGIEYNLSRLESYTIGQAGNATSTMIKAVGIVRFLQLLREHEEHTSLNPRYKYVLDREGRK